VSRVISLTGRLCLSKCLGTRRAKEASSGNCRVRETAAKQLIPDTVSTALILNLRVEVLFSPLIVCVSDCL